jgi:hypothetical protein
MSDRERYEVWLAGRRKADAPPGFADRVMVRVEQETPVGESVRVAVADATWFRVAACVAASVVFILRLGCAYSLFIPF